jgi:hypothetical protein
MKLQVPPSVAQDVQELDGVEDGVAVGTGVAVGEGVGVWLFDLAELANADSVIELLHEESSRRMIGMSECLKSALLINLRGFKAAILKL